MQNIRLALRDRRDSLLPEGVPRYLWCYADDGVTAGRYTAVFTGHFDLKQPVEYPYLTLGEDPAAIRRSGLRRWRPPYERMGREIRFEDLPEEIQAIVLDTCQELWGL